MLPLVNLSEKPWNTSWGLRERPYLEIIGWKSPGGDASLVPPTPATPQLTGPAAAPVETPPMTPSPTNNSAQPSQAKPKPPVNLGSETLAAMGDVKPATTDEILKDELPW